MTLRKQADFDRVFRAGQRIRCGEISVVRCPGSVSAARLGFVAPRRVGNAVERNRVKRRLREAARMVSWEQGYDYVIIGSREAKEAPFAVLVKWLTRATS
ncbi:MAG: ribonuclease P protein component [Acidimicrobiia bacterium]